MEVLRVEYFWDIEGNTNIWFSFGDLVDFKGGGRYFSRINHLELFASYGKKEIIEYLEYHNLPINKKPNNIL